MPKPKLPEEDKKEVVPLRLPKEAVAAVHDLAIVWGEKRGKEVKAATVARELVLIGLDVVAAVQGNKMLADLLRQGSPSDLVPKVRQVLNKSNGISSDDLALAIIKLLRAETITTNTPILDQFPDDEMIEATPYEEGAMPRHRKGGDKK